MKTYSILENIFGAFKMETFISEQGYYLANLKDEAGKIRGSGIRKDQQLAITVAISESIERHIYRLSRISRKYATDSHNSTCGFAVGTDEAATKLRSRLESIERWALSRWIDFRTPLKLIPKSAIKGISTDLLHEVQDHDFYFAEIFDAEHQSQLYFGVSILFSERGAFMGCRASFNLQDCLDHAVAEAWVAYTCYKNGTLGDGFVEERIKYFGSRKHLANQIIAAAQKGEGEWVVPAIVTMPVTEECPPPFFCFRSIAEGHIPWCKGDETRFVY